MTGCDPHMQACHTGGGHEVSAILQAIGVPLEFALGTLRLSVGRHTTAAEVDRAASLIIATAAKAGSPHAVAGGVGATAKM